MFKLLNFYKFCKAITISHIFNFGKDPIYLSIGGNIEKTMLCFNSFNRISYVDMRSSTFKHWDKNLEFIEKASVYIDYVQISTEIVDWLYRSYKNKLGRLKVNQLDLIGTKSQISHETVEVINEIKPNHMFIYDLSHSFDNLSICLSISSKYMHVLFLNTWNSTLEFHFSNSQIMLFDSNLNKYLNITCDSAWMNIKKVWFKDIVLVKTKRNLKEFDCMFIPLESVEILKLSFL